MKANEILGEKGWYEVDQAVRIKAVHQALDELINGLKSLEGVMIMVFGKEKMSAVYGGTVHWAYAMEYIEDRVLECLSGALEHAEEKRSAEGGYKLE